MTVAQDICISSPYFEGFNKATHYTPATALFLKERTPIKQPHLRHTFPTNLLVYTEQRSWDTQFRGQNQFFLKISDHSKHTENQNFTAQVVPYNRKVTSCSTNKRLLLLLFRIINLLAPELFF